MRRRSSRHPPARVALDGKGELASLGQDAGALGLTPGLGVGRVVIRIIGEMAPLARRLEHLIAAILGRVIEVHGGEHHGGAGDGMVVTMAGFTPPAMIVATFALALAPALRPHEADTKGDGFPIARIARAVLGADGHQFTTGKMPGVINSAAWPHRVEK